MYQKKIMNDIIAKNIFLKAFREKLQHSIKFDDRSKTLGIVEV
jgi:hypothetical protein